MTPADLRAAVLAGLATVEDLAAAAGLSIELAGELDVEVLTAARADVDAAAKHLRRLLARLPAEGDLGAVGGEDRLARANGLPCGPVPLIPWAIRPGLATVGAPANAASRSDGRSRGSARGGRRARPGGAAMRGIATGGRHSGSSPGSD
jgi:hypothetical protein